jgi:glycosyltransferase involved in cell wall biosynthesis
VYNARLAAAFVKLGHEVHLLTQDRHPEQQSFVDAAGDWDEGQLRVHSLRQADRPIRCTVYRPNIGTLRPVYVADRYEGIESKTFAECSEQEVARYIDANVAAVRELLELVEPDVALANHLVMGPVILARGLAGKVPYAVKVHGSALEYTVKPEPERFLPFAREGLARARAILVGSHHTAASLWEALSDPELVTRTRLGPPGVDVDRFAPRDPRKAAAGVRALAARLRAEDTHEHPASDAFALDGQAAADALERLDPERERLVGFVGKLIVSKGVDLLLAAWRWCSQRCPTRAWWLSVSARTARPSNACATRCRQATWSRSKRSRWRAARSRIKPCPRGRCATCWRSSRTCKASSAHATWPPRARSAIACC